jgi:thioesterase domain-containing protein/acyl carrier protein
MIRRGFFAPRPGDPMAGVDESKRDTFSRTTRTSGGSADRSFWLSTGQPGSRGRGRVAEASERERAEPARREEEQEQRDLGTLGLVALWEKVLDVRPVRPSDRFLDLGGDSLHAVELIDEIRKCLGPKIPLSVFLANPTCRELAVALHEVGMNGLAPSSLVLLQSGGGDAGAGANGPIFLIPGAGGNVFGYYRLTRHVDFERPVYGIRLPTPTQQPDRPVRVEDLAAGYIEEIRSVQPEGPYFIGGYSFGGRLALEIAQQLQARGQRIGLLAMFDTYGPGYPARPSLWLRLLGHVRLLGSHNLSWGWDHIVSTSRHWLAKTTQGMVLPSPLGYLVPQGIREDFDSHRHASMSYVPRLYPGPLLLFRASERPDLPGADFSDPVLGWDPLIEGGIEIQPVPGDHFSIFHEPHVRVLAERLKACLAVATRGAAVGRA